MFKYGDLLFSCDCCFQLTFIKCHNSVFVRCITFYTIYPCDCTIVRYGNIPCYFRCFEWISIPSRQLLVFIHFHSVWKSICSNLIFCLGWVIYPRVNMFSQTCYVYAWHHSRKYSLICKVCTAIQCNENIAKQIMMDYLNQADLEALQTDFHTLWKCMETIE